MSLATDKSIAKARRIIISLTPKGFYPAMLREGENVNMTHCNRARWRQ